MNYLHRVKKTSGITWTNKNASAWILSVIAGFLLFSCQRSDLYQEMSSPPQASPSSAYSIPRDSLTAEWLFSGTLDDTSGNHNNATESGGATYSLDRFGKTASACLFDGTNDYLLVTDTGGLQLTTQASFSFWVYIDPAINYSVYGGPHIFCKGATYGALYADYGFNIGSSTNSFEISDSGNTPHYSSLPPALSTGVWIHIVLVYQSSTLSLYTNGILSTPQAAYCSFRTSSMPLYIGHRYSDMNAGRFMGLIDDFRIYSRALTPFEIESLYHEGGYGL